MTGLKSLTINGVKYELTPEAIGAAPDGYGLGGASVRPTGSDWNNATENGWYSGSVNSPNGYMVHGFVIKYRDEYIAQIVWGYGNESPVECAQRIKTTDGWQPWEWQNPPMEAGVEYRTTERYQGAVVYKKVDANGNILWRKETDTQWRLLSTASFVD